MHNILNYLEHKKVVFWDWNGTLVDDFELAYGIFCNFLKAHDMGSISAQTYREKMKFPIKEFYLSVGYDFSKVSFEELSKEFYRQYDEGVGGCELHRGALEVIEACQKKSIQQYILTAAQEDHVKELLKLFKIEGYFKAVYGLKSRTADSKVGRARDLIDSLSVDVSDCLLVGDTLHDLEVGKALNIDVVLLSQGYQCIKVLQKAHHQVVERCTKPDK